MHDADMIQGESVFLKHPDRVAVKLHVVRMRIESNEQEVEIPALRRPVQERHLDPELAVFKARLDEPFAVRQGRQRLFLRIVALAQKMFADLQLAGGQIGHRLIQPDERLERLPGSVHRQPEQVRTAVEFFDVGDMVHGGASFPAVLVQNTKLPLSKTGTSRPAAVTPVIFMRRVPNMKST